MTLQERMTAVYLRQANLPKEEKDMSAPLTTTCTHRRNTQTGGPGLTGEEAGDGEGKGDGG